MNINDVIARLAYLESELAEAREALCAADGERLGDALRRRFAEKADADALAELEQLSAKDRADLDEIEGDRASWMDACDRLAELYPQPGVA